MASAAHYIAAHYASDLRMADLALHCHVSVRTLQNLFHAHCGEPPLRALRRYRLQQLHRGIAERPWTPLRAPPLPARWTPGEGRISGGSIRASTSCRPPC